jgi:hypothetical protein
MDDLNLDLSKVIDYGDVLGFITFSTTISNEDLKLFDNDVLIDDKLLSWKDLEN